MTKGDASCQSKLRGKISFRAISFRAVGFLTAASMLFASSAHASTLFRATPEESSGTGITQGVAILKDGFVQFGSSIKQGYKGVGRDVGNVIKNGVVAGYKDMGKQTVALATGLKDSVVSLWPFGGTDGRVYASNKTEVKLSAKQDAFPVSPVVEPVVDAPLLVTSEPVVEVVPPLVAPLASLSKSVVTQPASKPSVAYVVTKTGSGSSSDEVKKLIIKTVNDSLQAATNKMVSADNFTLFRKGLVVQGDLDLSGANVIGLKVATAPSSSQVIYVNQPSTGTSQAQSVIVGSMGGVTNDFTVGGNLAVTKNITITGASTFGGATFGTTSADSVTYTAGTLTFSNDTNFNLKNSSATALTIEGSLMAFDTANTRIGINSSTPGRDLDVGGSFMISGNGILGDASTDTLTVNASTTFANTMGVNGSVYLGDASTDLLTVMASSTYVNGVDILGHIRLGDASTDWLTVNASSTYANTAGFNGNTYIGDAATDQLTITATTTFKSGITAVDIMPASNASGNVGSASTAFAGLYVSTTVHMGYIPNGSLTGLELLTIGSGKIAFGSSSVFLTGQNTFVVGEIQSYFGGNVIIGDTNADTFTVNATTTHKSGLGVKGINPATIQGEITHNTYDIGSAATAFRAIYASTSYNIGPASWTFAGNTSTFSSSMQDVAQAVAFDFNTSNTITSSTVADSRALMTVRNNGVRKFVITPGGGVLATSGITGNAASASIGDLAEYVDLSPGQVVESGDTIQADPINPGKFRMVTEANASNVAGIISNTAVFSMGASGEGRAALGLSGIVYGKVIDENGPIEVGDLLVTASKAGYLMKYDSKKSRGALIVGSAIEPLTAGESKIKILVRSGAYGGGGSTLTTSLNANGTLVTNDMDGQAFTNIHSLSGIAKAWEIDSEGRLTSKQVKAEKYTVLKTSDPKAATVGSGIIAQGQGGAVISSSAINFHSRVFVTFTTNLNGRTYYVTDKMPGESFSVKVSYVADEPLSFDYWILDVEGEEDVSTSSASTQSVVTETVVAETTTATSETSQEASEPTPVAVEVVAPATETISEVTAETVVEIVATP